MTNKAVDPITPVDDNPKVADQVNPGGDAGKGRLCPNCHTGYLAFDGCLNLTCPVCGFTDTGGGFT
jgi:uncharacterized protein (DUF983 family)